MSKVLEFDSKGSFSIRNNCIKHPGLNENYTWARPIKQDELILFKEGFCLFHSYNILKLNITKLSRVWMNDLDKSFINHEDQLSGIIISDDKLGAISDYKNVLDINQMGTDKKFEIESKRIVITKDKYSYLMERDRLRSGFKKELKIENEGNYLISLVQGNPPESELDFDILESNHKNINLYVDYYLSGNVTNEEYNHNIRKDTYARITEELYNDEVLIPYNDKDRLNKFKDLFKKLSNYTEKYN